MKTLLLTVTALFAGGGDELNPPRPSWDADTVSLFATLPIQDQGRIKPMSTYAGFMLLRLNGKRSLTTPSGERIDAMRWFLDLAFYPEIAESYECFRVENDEVMEAIGVAHEGKERFDRYSFKDIEPKISKLFDLAERYGEIDSKKRTRVEEQIVYLSHSVLRFLLLRRHFDFARTDFSTAGSEQLKSLFGGVGEVSFSQVLSKIGPLRDLYRDLQEGKAAEGSEEARQLDQERQAVEVLLTSAGSVGGRSRGLAWIPPTEDVASAAEWLSTADVMMAVPPEVEHLGWLANLERLVSSRDERSVFREELEKLHGGIADAADARDEYGAVALEVFYYKGDFFYRALVLYLISFLLIAVWLLRPAWNLLRRLLFPAVVLPTLLVATGITLRCVIQGRPPVLNLYDTIIFITLVGATVSLITEWINRQRVALVVASLLGSLGMFMAGRYEVNVDAAQGDTMRSMVAVLDTNFWLATHVTTVNIGYAAGLFAGALAHVYILGKLFGLKKGSFAFYHSLSRMLYGAVCFGLLFSVVGTILGGIWANDSWGRFWGWDPKENGALLIVIMNLLILHGRMGGYLREFGTALCAVFLGCVVAFSWFGVNELGVGLHSYGFTEGVVYWLLLFYGIEAVVLIAGLYARLREKHERQLAEARASGGS